MFVQQSAKSSGECVRVAVCDDEASVRSDCATLVRAIAAQRDFAVVVDEYENASMLWFALNGSDDPPDIIILDVLMPKQDGITAGVELRSAGYVGIVIYISRSDIYAMFAFDVGAYGYVLKPIEENCGRFERVFVGAVRQVRTHRDEYILVRGAGEHRNIMISSILYFESSGHIVSVYYGDGKIFEFLSSLEHIVQSLSSFGFARVHRSYVVNCTKVESFDFKRLVLINGRELPISKTRYSEFKRMASACAKVEMSQTS